ncbi:filamentous hemagglutinin N-terminal domain-containing protein [Simiduia sp. 21SJ11W-1]|uniref:filamentous hemagglutinin N-terminal domain-containing protein n=1 Tax=Simiduia sp. 21SJ11W-1 TaxID=2909669 RepID=UPI0020A20133|nr:filamentous hemagglutinin N-terminal domain-containing protein [Simiduia sp. 21SJ11W-1]UTA46611.1 filamentous hemagglutinin N-terminal domain-containing protein [Simiduia sp. 21SJ11W-1]
MQQPTHVIDNEASKKMTPRKILARAVGLQTLVMGGMLTTMIGSLSPSVLAGPTGGTVVGGQGDITTDDKTTRVDQFTDLMAVNWDSFNIAADEKVLYVQPSASSLVLNRILDDNASVVRGSIEANGHVLLVNPQGVLFTDTATVNVQGIAVSGLDINPSDFLNGDYKLNATSGTAGSVINYGVINASSAALVGKHVANHGLIKADLVSLAVAGEAILSFGSDSLLGVQVSKALLEKETGIEQAILNAGDIEGQQVLLDASVAKGLFDSAVNNTGTVTARGIDTSGGVIRLTGSGGNVAVGGRLDADGTGGQVHIEGDSASITGVVSANNASGAGGNISVLGTQVNLASSAEVTADGSAGGGTIQLGGDLRGQGSLRLAENTAVQAGAKVSASATESGDGGTLVVWAEQSTTVAGSLAADAAGATGNGGFIETSGKESVHLTGSISAAASGGDAGTWLIDPGFLEIGAENGINKLSASELATSLATQNVTIISNEPVGTFDAYGVKVSEDISVDGDGSGTPTTLTLTAAGGDADAEGIVIEADISATNHNLNLALNSNKDITIAAGSAIELNDGNFTAVAQGSFLNSGLVDANAVAITVGASGADTVNQLGDLTYQSLSLSGGAGLDSFDLSSLDNLVFSISDSGVLGLMQGANVVAVDGIERWVAPGSELAIDAALASPEISLSVLESTVNGLDNQAPVAQISSNASQIVELVGLTHLSGSGLGVQDVSDASIDAELSIADSSGIALLGNQLVYRGNGSTPFELMLEGVTSVAAGRRFTLTAVAETITLDAQKSFDTDNGISVAGASFTEIDMGGTASGGAADTIAGGAHALVLTGGNNNIAVGGLAFTQVDAVSTTVTAFSGSDQADVVSMTSRKTFDANNISVVSQSNFSSIDLKGNASGQDVVYGDGTRDWMLSASGAESRNIEFLGLEQVITGGDLSIADGLGDISVSSGDFAGGQSLVLNGIGFQRTDGGSVTYFSSVSAGSGSNFVVDGSSFSGALALRNGSGKVQAAGTELSGVGAVNGGDLSLLSRTDSTGLAINAANGFEAAGIGFSAIGQVTGLGASDTVQLAAGFADDLGWSLTDNGVDNGIASTDLVFYGNGFRVDNITTTLAGRAQADTFVLSSGGELTANSIVFSGVTDVAAGEAATDDANVIDSVQSASGVVWSSLGSESVSAGSINFTQIEQVTNIDDGASITGVSGAVDSLSNLSDSAITLNGVQFNSAGTFGGLNLQGGDSLALANNDQAQIIGSGTVNLNNLAFDISGVDAVSGGEITTQNSVAANITLDGLGGFELADIAFSNSRSVTATAAGSSVTGGDGWSFVDNNSARIQTLGGMAFEGFDSVTTSAASLSGSNLADNISVTDSQNVAINNIDFTTTNVSGFGAVDLGEGNDTLDAGADTNAVALTGANNEAVTRGLILTSLNEVTGGSLQGSDNADTFQLTGANTLLANSIAFSGISNVNADGVTDNGEQDRVISRSGQTWTLDSQASQQVTTDGIQFTGVELAEGLATAINLADSAANLIYTDSQLIAAGALAFSTTADFSSLSGTGANALTGTSTTQWQLTDSSVVADGALTITGFNAFTNGHLTGRSSGGNDYTYTAATGDVDVAHVGFTFSGLQSVAGNSSTDTVTSDADWRVVDNNSASTNGLVFSAIESVQGTGNLYGSDNSDTFTISGSNVAVGNITYQNITAVDGQGGAGDHATTAESGSWTLGTASNSALGATFGGITFTNIAQASGGSGSLTGSTGADTYSAVSAGSVTANGIAFTGLTEVNAQDGDDTLSASGSTVSLNGGDVSLGGVTFKGLANVAGANIESQANTSFSVSAANTLAAEGVTFTGVTAVAANGSSDSANTTTGWTLLGATKAATTQSIAFTGLESATGSSNLLTGSAAADQFELSGAAVIGNGISFTGITQVAAGEAATGDANVIDSVQSASGVVWSSLGNESVSAGPINFTQIEQVTNIDDGASITGVSGAVDSLSNLSDSAITLNGVQFNSAGTFGGLNLQGGDSLALANNDQAQIIGSGTVNLNNLAFDISGVDAVSGGEITTQNSVAANITLDGLGGFELADIAFSNSRSVTATAAGSSITGGDGWSFVDNNSTRIQTLGGMAFEGFDSVTTSAASLSGSNLADNISVTDSQNVTINNIDFTTTNVSGFGAVDLGEGNDTLDAGADTNAVALTGANNEAVTRGLILTSLNEVTGGSLQGSDNADTFQLTGANTLLANSIAFSGISNVNADGVTDNGEQDRVISRSGQTWILDSQASQQVTTDGIQFTGVELAEGLATAINLADSAANLIYTDSQLIAAGALAFSTTADFSSLSGTGANALTGTSTTQWQLTDSSVVADGALTITGFNAFTNGHLTGRSSGGNDYTYTAATGDVDVAHVGFTFSGLQSVAGNSSTDTVTSDADWRVVDNNSASTNGLVFSAIESVQGTGNLYGSDNSDTFTISGSNVAVGNITYQNITAVDGQGGAGDHATTAESGSWTLGTASNSALGATFGGIAFTNIAQASGGSGSLTGSTGADTYSAVSAGSVTANGIAFTGLTEVNAQDGDDTLSASGSTVSLNGGDVSLGGVTFKGLANVAGANIESQANTSFSVSAANTLAAEGVTFTGVTAVAANGSSDSANTTTGWTLLGATKAATTQSIAFTGLESATGSSNLLTGSVAADQFELSGAAVIGNGISFTGITQVAAGAGTDQATGAAGQAWEVLATNSAINNGVTFTNINSLTGDAQTLTVTANDDYLQITGVGAVSVAGMDITATGGLTTVDMAAGTDTVVARADQSFTILSGANSLHSDGMDFLNVELGEAGGITGGQDDGEYKVLGVNQISSNGISVSGVSYFDAAGGYDVVTGLDGEAWTLLATGAAENFGITFANVEKLFSSSSEIFGSTGADQFALVSDNLLNASGMAIEFTNGLTLIDGNGGADSVLGLATTQYQLEESYGYVTAGSIALHNIASFSQGSLTGRAQADAFAINADGDVNVSGFTFSALAGIDGNGGSNTAQIAASDNVTLNGAGAVVLGDVNGLLLNRIGQITGDISSVTLASDVSQATIGAASNVTAAGIALTSSHTNSVALNVSNTNTLVDFQSSLVTVGEASRQLSTDTLNVTGVGQAAINYLKGEGAIALAVNADASVDVSGIAITGLVSYDGAASTDTISGAEARLLAGQAGLNIAGIDLTAVELLNLTDGQLFGSAEGEAVDFTSAASLAVNGINVSAAGGFTLLDLGAGTDTVNLGVRTAELTGVNNAFMVDGALVQGVDSVQAANIASNTAVDFLQTGAQSVSANSIAFDGVELVTVSNAVATLTGADQVLQAADNSLTIGDIVFRGLANVDANGLQLSDLDNSVTIGSNGAVSTGGVSFTGLTLLDTAGGIDSVQATSTHPWQIFDDTQTVQLDQLTILNAESLSGSSALSLHSDNTQVTIEGDQSVSTAGMVFSGLTDVATMGAGGRVSGRTGELWALNNDSVGAGAINFLGFSAFNAEQAVVSTATGTHNYQVSESGQQVSAGNLSFDGVARLQGSASDTVTLVDGAQVQLAAGGYSVAGLNISGINSIFGNGLALLGSTDDEMFTLLDGEERVAVNGLELMGVARVDGGGGSDQLTSGNESRAFVLGAEGDLSVAGIMFDSITQVNALGSTDSVTASDASWYAQTQNGVLASQSSLAVLDTISVLFNGVESVAGTGSLYGADVDSHFQMTDLSTLVYGDINYGDVTRLEAGAGNHSLTASDLATQWQLQEGASTATSGDSSFTFSGVGSLNFGAGQDVVSLTGGSFTAINTGAGNDQVSLLGGSLDTLALGAGDDVLTIADGGMAPASFEGNNGADSLISGGALGWALTSVNESNALGGYSFTGFETLVDASAAIQANVQAAANFTGKTVTTGGMTLSFAEADSLNFASSATGNAITGDVTVADLKLSAAGNVDLTVTSDLVDISRTSNAIDVSLAVTGDTTIQTIDAGTGNILLTSTALSSLSFAPDAVNLIGSNVQLGTEASLFIGIGSVLNPARIQATDSVRFISLDYVEPLYFGSIPQLTSFTGNRQESIYGAQAAQGVKSAVQTAVEDFAQVDPAIFEAVSPYSTSANALAGGEFRLVAGVLLPADATAAGEDDERKKKSGQSEQGAQEILLEVPNELKPELKEGYESSYKIEAGDTFWDIAEKFLKNPFKWPDLWKQNPNVTNPDKIYPGDVIKVLLRNDSAYLIIEAGHSEAEDLCKAGRALGQVAVALPPVNSRPSA